MNFLQHFEHRLVRAAVQRTPQRANARRRAGKQIRLARGHHAHGRGGAILLVIGVQQENQIQRLDHFRLQLVILVRQREHHVQEIRRVLVVRLGINDRQPARFAIGKRRDRAHLRNQPRGLHLEMLVRHFRREQLGIKAARRR